jgi:hypothetical protein
MSWKEFALLQRNFLGLGRHTEKITQKKPLANFFKITFNKKFKTIIFS